MANIKEKDVKDLSIWDKKALRKLRMTINNRISALSISKDSKELSKDHPLYELEVSGCKELLEKVVSAESKL